MKLVLASKSPRRKELLKKYGFDFTAVTTDFNEVSGTDPAVVCEENAVGKSLAVYNSLKSANVVVLGSDTVVYFNKQTLGKPKDADDAKRMLKMLSGQTHQVFTGYSIIKNGDSASGYFMSKVTFNELSPALIEEYVESGLPLDKAGAYGVQDDFNIVKKIDGSFNNVMGLPIEKIDGLLKEFLND